MRDGGGPVAVAQAKGSEQAASTLEPVQGHYGYTFGDADTPTQAKQFAQQMAQEQAVKSYRVYVQSASTVKNFQLEEDLIHTVSAGMLHEVRVAFEEKGRKFCATVAAKIDPVKMETLIQQQVKAKDVAQQAQASLFAAGSAFGLQVSTNKPDGRYVEGESLIVSVQSERDG